jgi:anthranilate synthase/aminodeoxychorismate synthase-like glutamine amidotransferase
MILLIDNYDSFVYNLKRYFVRLGEPVVVVRNDDVHLINLCQSDSLIEPNSWGTSGLSLPRSPTAIVLSPGPKRPQDAGCCLDLIRKFSGQFPILGVCLGHQAICEAFGGRIIRALQPVHGRATPMRLQASRLFEGLTTSKPDGLVEFGRYHSLVADPATLPDCLRVIARSIDQQIMAVEHSQHPTFGIQFHPESVLSPQGYRVLSNFLTVAGRKACTELPASDLGTAISSQTLFPHG